MAINSFTIMPRVLSHLGDELIRNEIIALTELVKNAYDANAENCTVEFYFNEDDRSDYRPQKIVIYDDGDGMTKDEILNYWLTVGTDHKRNDLFAYIPSKRIPLGEKGIGRFGVHKLGKKIKVKTKTKRTKPLSFEIDWSLLDKAKSFEDFGVDIKSNRVKFNGEKGLTYIIEDIKGDWTRQKLRKIYRALIALNAEFTSEDCRLRTNEKVSKLIKFSSREATSDQFRVSIEAINNDTVFKNLKNFDEIKESAFYECDILLSGNQIEDFEYRFHPIGNIKEKFDPRFEGISSLNAGERLLQRKAELISDEIDESRLPKGLFKKNEVVDLAQKEIGDIYVKLFAFERTPSVRSAAETGEDVNTYLKENGGIRVYRDGMRVYDYGEKGNDWLGLSSTADIGKKLRNEHVVGYVFLDRKSSTGLVEKTNREGFIENDSYYIFSDALKWAIKYTFLNYRNPDKEKLSEYYSKSAEPVISLLEDTKAYIDEHLEDDKHKKVLTGYVYRIQKEYKTIVDTLYQSAGLGILSATVVHEIEKLIKEINLQIQSSSESARVKMLVRRLDTTIKKFSFLIKKTDVKKHDPESIYRQVLLFIDLRFQKHSINVAMDSDTEVKCSASMNHATNVLLNILDNSIYWLNNAKEKNKKIRIFITDKFEEGDVTILVADNGPGFHDDPKYLVKPFVSTKPYSIGSGLGLYVADELMKGMNGSLSFPDYDDVSEYFDDDTFKSGAIVALNFKKVD
ncbi:ATP-binding protein [Desulfovibrio aminophilus]|uniref:ATP-binding protein n=1 Tax=Desulfovibrio aminophilus TaxID=81425 RepID=UPI00339711AC